jgi:hypothetical protein
VYYTTKRSGLKGFFEKNFSFFSAKLSKNLTVIYDRETVSKSVSTVDKESSSGGDYFTPPVSGRSIAEVGLNNIFYPLILSTIHPTAHKTSSKKLSHLY